MGKAWRCELNLLGYPCGAGWVNKEYIEILVQEIRDMEKIRLIHIQMQEIRDMEKNRLPNIHF